MFVSAFFRSFIISSRKLEGCTKCGHFSQWTQTVLIFSWCGIDAVSKVVSKFEIYSGAASHAAPPIPRWQKNIIDKYTFQCQKKGPSVFESGKFWSIMITIIPSLWSAPKDAPYCICRPFRGAEGDIYVLQSPPKVLVGWMLRPTSCGHNLAQVCDCYHII